MEITRSSSSEHAEICAIHRVAFGIAEGGEVANLVADLLSDETARPLLSLVAKSDGNLVGHVLFTAATLLPGCEVSVQILAPLGVLPGFQSTGVGGSLIREGLDQLTRSGVDLVFVLGHPGYYPKFGFQPAGVLGFDAPYPIPSEHADSWMVQELKPGVIETFSGTIKCSAVLNQPQHWRE